MKKNKTVEIRRELKALIVSKQIACITEKEKNRALNEARMEINKKYGKDWREAHTDHSEDIKQLLYEGHQYGEHWMD